MRKRPLLIVAILQAAICISAAAAAADTVATQPAPDSPPAWIGPDAAKWPQLLCTNEIRFTDSDLATQGGGAFLMRLPDGSVVAGTAKHILTAEFPLGDFQKKVRTYILHSRLDPRKIMVLPALAVTPADVEDLDWAIMTVGNPRGPFPVEVLPARDTRLDVGETVYLAGVPGIQKTAQNIYTGIVLRRQPHEFIFQINTRLEQTAGLSGSPIIDTAGHIAGVLSGHLEEQPNPDKTNLVGVDTALVLDLIHLPPSRSGVITRPAINPAARPSVDSAAAADSALREAKLLIDNHVYDLARQRLGSIITTYPNTPAADEARRMLAEIDGK